MTDRSHPSVCKPLDGNCLAHTGLARTNRAHIQYCTDPGYGRSNSS